MSFSGTRKHLNLLIEDYRTSSDRETIRSTYPSYESNVTVEDSTTGRFEPPYVTGGTHARDMSRMVNARRTPSGNFFQVANPSLAPKQPKVTMKPKKSFAEIFRRNTKDVPEENQAEVQTFEELQNGESVGAKVTFAEEEAGGGGGEEVTTTTALQERRTWNMPSQFEDRVSGAKVAKLVSSKRTPTGGFFAMA